MLKIIDFFYVLTPIVIIYYFIIPKRWKSHFLLICSMIFISFLSWEYLLFFILNIILVYFAGILMRKGYKERKSILQFVLIWLIANLCFFKCVNIWRGSASGTGIIYELYRQMEFSRLILPVGLSYVTFRLIHYIVEIYRDNTPQGSFVEFALFVLFFPTFLAGPVDRFQRFCPQIRETGVFSISNINSALFRIVRGLVKKVIFADNLRNFILPILVSPQSYNRSIVVCAIYVLTIQVYMDFSGYTDMAIGISRLFGYTIMENFDRPFFKKNIALFWRSWHISMYSWIRDYFFLPLFGFKASKTKLYAGIVLTMLVFHLWHSFSLSFIVLGLYHGSGLLIWQLFHSIKKKSVTIRPMAMQKYLDLLSVAGTFSFVSFGTIFLVADFTQAMKIISRMVVF